MAVIYHNGFEAQDVLNPNYGFITALDNRTVFRLLPINPTTSQPLRVREYRFAFPNYWVTVDTETDLGAAVLQDATRLHCYASAYLPTPTLRVANSIVASGLLGSISLYTFAYFEMHGFLDAAVGTLDTYCDGLLVVSFSGATVPSGQTYLNALGFYSSDGINQFSINTNPTYVRKMPDGRGGGASAVFGINSRNLYLDDIVFAAPSMLVGSQVGIATLVAGDLITAPGSGATIYVSDVVAAGATFPAGVVGRIWGYSWNGIAFIDGEAIHDGDSSFTGTARVGLKLDSSPWDGGLEPMSGAKPGFPGMSAPIGNGYIFPSIPTANNTVTLTPSAGTNHGNAAQIPPGPNYNENATVLSKTDTYNAAPSPALIAGDVVLAVCVGTSARKTDESSTHITTQMTDTAGTTVSSAMDLATSYKQYLPEVIVYKSDLTALTPADVELQIGVTLEP